jgi:4-hydroxy-3-methylbut-2-enyl diphosphate reductase
MEDSYYRKGFGLKGEIHGTLVGDYHSALVDEIRSRDYALTVGGLTVHLAREFGFCYGVDRAVVYAYETRAKFPAKRIFLVGEIIHNPHVNARLASMGIVIIRRSDAGEFDFGAVAPEDVVIMPAFGVTKDAFDRLRALGCVLVDTTCGSVLNVWKRVESYARDGFTSVIHGKVQHEETRATASQVGRYPGGRFIVIRDMSEARLLCEFIEHGGSAAAVQQRFRVSSSPDFEPQRDLARIGVANQTTMLSGDSLAIAAELRASMVVRYGEAEADQRFRTFDTICSATQDRQDAVLRLLDDAVEVMLVIGGYNSSNTTHLAALCAKRVPTYHIEDSTGVVPEASLIRHKPVGGHEEMTSTGWLRPEMQVVGVTAGASTPNVKVGETIARIFATRGIDLAEVLP